MHSYVYMCIPLAFAVFDVMRNLKCPLITINTGLTVGMGALLCAVGSPGKRYVYTHLILLQYITHYIPLLYRYAMPNSRFLMARTGIEDGFQGQAIDISKAVKEVR